MLDAIFKLHEEVERLRLSNRLLYNYVVILENDPRRQGKLPPPIHLSVRGKTMNKMERLREIRKTLKGLGLKY